MKKTVNALLLLLTSVSILHGQPVQDTLLERTLPRITGWADNGHYIVERWVPEARTYSRTAVDIRTGEEKEYTAAEKAEPNRVEATNGDIYLISGSAKRRLTETEAMEKNPMLSPDGRRVAFTRDNDLYSIEISTGHEVRYTRDGSDIVLNGYASWVYYEEIFGRASNHRAFWWSPDSRHLAFYRFDDSGVPVFPIYNSTGQHGYVEMTRYPKAGDPNPEVMVGVVAAEGGEVVWADFDPADDQYFGRPFWRPNGSGLLVQWMSREQDNLKLYDVDPASGMKNEIYDERQPTWISWIDRFQWVKDGFLMVRDFDGWEQIYYHAHNGALRRKLTTGRNWRTRIIRVDEKTQTLFYTGNGEHSTRTDLYSVRLDGRQQKRLTFGEYHHEKLMLSPDGRLFLTTYSNRATPSRIAIVDTHSGRASVIADSKGPGFDAAALNLRRMVCLRTDDGFDLPGMVEWPANMEEGRKYPVIIRIYGGPNSSTLTDKWTSPRFDAANNEQTITVFIEHRGTGHCGKQGLDYLHRNLGKWEMADYIAWVGWLRGNPAVDADRIMITGGSYGGYLTALALTYGAEYFNYGIADYPVTDWMLYDSHYTERYMDHPADNPEGYRAASVLTHAENYQTNGPAMLLIQHGLMDDNVHAQNSIQLIDLFQKQNKTFELMIYPNERHGWRVKVPFTNGTRTRFRNKYLYNKD